jgi:hypothetical protein
MSIPVANRIERLQGDFFFSILERVGRVIQILVCIPIKAGGLGVKKLSTSK